MTLLYTTTDNRYELRKAHADDAGYDLHSAERVTLAAGEQRAIRTPFCIALPAGYIGLICDRSGLASRHIYTHGGVIDAGYRGTLTVLLENRSGAPLEVSPGDRVAQLLVIPLFAGDAEKRLALPDSERGSDGFGSTGA